VMPITEPAPRSVSRRKPLPEHLPREIHVHQPESQCSGCGGTLRQLGRMCLRCWSTFRHVSR
jgi:transposase